MPIFFALMLFGLFGNPRFVIAELIVVSTPQELMATSGATLKENSTVLIEDGVYEVTGSINIFGKHITYKSASGKRDSVVLKGKGCDGDVDSIFSISGSNIHIENLTLGEVKCHGIQIHGENNADYIYIKNVKFYNSREQMLKGTYDKARPENYTEYGSIENCLFEFTDGKAYQAYTGGIDVHHGRKWIVKNNIFRNITTGGKELTADGAIHFWTDSEDILIEGNKIINCDRGILLGLDNVSHNGGMIKNNFIQTTQDVGIYLCNTVDVSILYNTIYIDSTYPNAIEYRFPRTRNNLIAHNLSNRDIISRNQGEAFVSNNVTNARKHWFANAGAGDLHLSQRLETVSGRGAYSRQVDMDIDREVRNTVSPDIGADEQRSAIVKTITRLNLSTDKNEISADGVSVVRLKATVEYEDRSVVEVDPDQFDVTSGNKTSHLLGDRFTSKTPGLYHVTARLGGDVSNSVEISVKGMSDAQTTGLSVWHREGQSFLVFKEIVDIFPENGITYREYFERKKQFPRTIQYYVYRSDRPIQNLQNLEPVARVNSFSGWNDTFYGLDTATDMYAGKPAVRYVSMDGGPPLAKNQGICVLNPKRAGASYYAVTVVVDGKENRNLTLGENATSEPVNEIVGPGLPVLQRIETPNEFQYINNAQLFFYTRWECPPNASVDGKPFDYLVAIPPKLKIPAPVGIHMHSWGGNLLGGYAWWNDAEDGAILLSSTEIPYDWWVGYHEKIFTVDPPKSEKSWKQGVVRPYATTRLLSFLKFLNEKSQWKIDGDRVFTAGASMGGAGSLMMAIRYPEKIAWARSWVGVHIPEKSPQFKSSYEYVWGDRNYNVLFEDGTPVWDYYNDAKYLVAHPEKEVGFLSFSNGKNDSQIGWPQAVEFLKALQKTRRPFLFVWGQEGHGQRTIFPKNGSEQVMAIDIAVNKSLPAFTHCTIDDDPGNGDPNDGAPTGQINRWLYWETEDAVDSRDRWEMTLRLRKEAPKDVCRVDVTPRRVQQFKPGAGQKVAWENRTLDGKIIEKGDAVVDAIGLITLEQVIVTKSGNRIFLTKR